MDRESRLDPLVAVPAVLIVDDDDYVRRIIERMLRVIGISTIHQAESAAVALDIVGQHEVGIDVVISDLDMPGIDGMEFLRLLSDERPGIAVLVVSGKDEGILRSVDLMAHEYGLTVMGAVPKPMAVAGLRTALARYRPRDRQGDSPDAAVSVADIAGALDRQEFVLLYQPKVDLTSRRVTGAEALARWRHPDRGLLPPRLFIDLAEQHGLIDRLTFALFEQAAAVVKRWHHAGVAWPVSLNVSQTTLADTTFAGRVIDLFSRFGLAPRQLVIEVTETVAMTDVAHCLETLSRLRMNGVGLSIDDFGTGHASFQQLSRVPYTELKIDRGFVTAVSDHPRMQAIVESSISIARELGLTCAAEGVETDRDWEFLRQAGCHVAQGFFIARPMAGDGLPAWAHAWENRVPPANSQTGSSSP
jgi:EAL domain-containing protein (putative c-di-GMP-specific phosphodiesterase class I)/CheY-like chemotaxis protein